MKEPVLLWKPLADVPPEPEMIMTYGELSFAVPYTLLHSLIGWVQVGGSGTSALDGTGNCVAALKAVLQTMQETGYPPDEETIAWYKAQGIYQPPLPMPVVRDYRNEKPFTAQELAETATMRKHL